MAATANSLEWVVPKIYCCVVWLTIFKRLGHLPCATHSLENSDNHEDKILADSFKTVLGCHKFTF